MEGLIDLQKEAVFTIKSAILKSQQRVAQLANRELLSLYYSIGKYVSVHTRNEAWGSGAINNISSQLQKELPGLHGISSASIKRMRLFYEKWDGQELSKTSKSLSLGEKEAKSRNRTTKMTHIILMMINAEQHL